MSSKISLDLVVEYRAFCRVIDVCELHCFEFSLHESDSDDADNAADNAISYSVFSRNIIAKYWSLDHAKFQWLSINVIKKTF